jgi:enoyl-CoA hydratase/carnithine racemase
LEFNDILVENTDGVAIITLNRPAQLNSLMMASIEELNQALDTIEADDSIGVVVISGSPRPDGRPCFCAGLDLKEIAENGVPRLTRGGTNGAIEGLAVLGVIENPFMLLCDRLESFPKPTIAAIDGICTGGGLEIALCCDFRIVAETAKVSDLHLKNLGVIGGGGATVRLTHAVGPSKAKEIAFTGEPLSGEEAYRIGLANKVVPSAELLAGAKDFAGKMVSISSSGLRLAKASIHATLNMNLRDALRYSYVCWAAALAEADESAKKFAGRSGESK